MSKNRPIKFRAWDKNRQRMFLNVTQIMFGSPHNLVQVIDDIRAVENTTDVELMQFTGLHDKKGKEIYEGDIIRSTENSEVLKVGDILPLSRHLDLLAENIGYYDNKNKYHLRSAGGQYHLDDWVSNPEFYEVIGNIWENPELLN